MSIYIVVSIRYLQANRRHRMKLLALLSSLHNTVAQYFSCMIFSDTYVETFSFGLIGHFITAESSQLNVWRFIFRVTYNSLFYLFMRNWRHHPLFSFLLHQYVTWPHLPPRSPPREFALHAPRPKLFPKNNNAGDTCQCIVNDVRRLDRKATCTND